MTSKSTPNAEFEQLSPTACRVTVTVSPDKFRSKLDSIYNDLARDANIPGFRPGKAPRNILNRRFGREKIIHDATEDVIEDSLWPVLKEKELSIVGHPRVDHDEWNEGESFSYTAVMEIIPPIPDLDYKDIRIVLPVRELKDEMVDEEVEHLSYRVGESTEIKDRPVKEGDFILVDFEAETPDVTIETIEGEAPWRYEQKYLEIHVGAGKTIKGLDEHLTGMELEEIREFKLELPDDFPDKRVGGKTADVEVRITAIREVKPVEWTDDLIVEKFGEQGIQNLEELREKIGQEIQSNWAKADERATVDQIESYLSRAFDFPLPEGLVRSRYADIMDRSLESMKKEGTDIDQLMEKGNEAGEKIRKRARYQAERLTRIDLIMREVGRKESIRVADEEVANYLMLLAYRQGLNEKDLRTLMKDPQFIAGTKEELLRKKVTHFLIDKTEAERIAEEEFDKMVEEAREEAESHEKEYVESSVDPDIALQEDYLAEFEPEQKEAVDPAQIDAESADDESAEAEE
jgi:trigger factor